MAHSPSPSSPKRRRVMSSIRTTRTTPTPRRSIAPGTPTTASVRQMMDMNHEQALIAVAKAEHDVNLLTEKLNDSKENIVEFKNALQIHSMNVEQLKTKMAPFEAKLKSEKSLLTHAQQGLRACEISIELYEKALHTATVDLEKAKFARRRVEAIGAGTLPPAATYLQLGIDTMEGVREKEGLKTSKDVFMLSHKGLTDLLRKFRQMELPLVPGFAFGAGHRIKTTGSLENLRSRVLEYLSIFPDDEEE